MDQITLRIPTELLESLDEDAAEHGVSRSEYIRDLLDSHSGHDGVHATPDRVRELEDALDAREQEIDRLETECDRLKQEKRLIIEQQEEHDDLVAYVESEQRLQQRREQRQNAPVWKRAKWWVLGWESAADRVEG